VKANEKSAVVTGGLGIHLVGVSCVFQISTMEKYFSMSILKQQSWGSAI
jgi:hypothetical protein